jgi:hypothetical protein
MDVVKKYWLVPVVLLVAVGLYVGLKNGVGNLFSSFGLGPNSTKKAEAEMEALTYDPSKVRISQSDGILISQQLLAAMDQWGTDQKTVIRLLSGRNRDELLMIIKTFGIKPYNGAGLSQWIDQYLYSVDLNLQGWLNRELTGSYIAQAAQIFSQNNIAF